MAFQKSKEEAKFTGGTLPELLREAADWLEGIDEPSGVLTVAVHFDQAEDEALCVTVDYVG